METWIDLYTEIATRINTEITEIAWVDLWHEQISYLTDEIPFSTPSVFLAFITKECQDRSLLIQDCDIQVDMYLFFETFSDTYQGAYNQRSAIDFLKLLSVLHSKFHGYSGTNFSNMRRVDMVREDTGGAGNLYRISFACMVEDTIAQKEYNQQVVNEISIDKVEDAGKPSTQDEKPLYYVKMS